MMRGNKQQATGNKIISGALILLCAAGCANVKEACRGVAGISTRILEDQIDNAIAKEYPVDIAACRDRARKALQESGAYIYAEDKAQQLIAVYVSETDTTPVGLFFKEKDKQTTVISFSSPSAYAKELIAERVNKALTKR